MSSFSTIAKLCRQFPRAYALNPAAWQGDGARGGGDQIRRIIALAWVLVESGEADEPLRTVLRRELANLEAIRAYGQANRHLFVYCYCEAVGCCDAILTALTHHLSLAEVYGCPTSLRLLSLKLLADTGARLVGSACADEEAIVEGRLGVLEAAHLAALAFDADSGSAKNAQDRAFVTDTSSTARSALAALSVGDCQLAGHLLTEAASRLLP